MTRRFQFSLRSLLVIVGYFSVFFAVLQNDQLDALQRLGVATVYLLIGAIELVKHFRDRR